MYSAWSSRLRIAVLSHLTRMASAAPLREDGLDLSIRGKIAGIGLGKAAADFVDLPSLARHELLECAVDDPGAWTLHRARDLLDPIPQLRR